MSTIQIRNKMDIYIYIYIYISVYENHFYFVANAQLFDSSESTEISPMWNMAVNIVADFHILIQIIKHAN